MENKLILPEDVKAKVLEAKKNKINLNAWYYTFYQTYEAEVNDKPTEMQFTEATDFLNDANGNPCVGFVYLIENLENGKKYLGKKSLNFIRTLRKGKKELALMTDRRSSKKKVIVKESDWLKYTGSNTYLNNDIKKGDRYKKHILALCYSKQEMTYLETKYQFTFEVLESPEYYNGNILGKFYNQY